MNSPKKYYFNGYECVATWLPEQGFWSCRVDNVTVPFVFEASEERTIQGNFEREVRTYIERCEQKGVAPRRSVMEAAQGDRSTAINRVLREQDKKRKQRAAQKEREFQRSPWRYAVAALLVGIPALGWFMLASLGRIIPFTLFFPYRAHVQSQRLPVLTALVCLVCWGVFLGQWMSEARYEEDCTAFLQQEAAKDYLALSDGSCWPLEYVRRSPDKEMQAIEDLQYLFLEDEAVSEIYDADEIRDLLLQVLPHYAARVEPAFTDAVMYWPNRGDFSGVYSSQFAHADFGHIFFNLIFFFAFAATVERLAGHLFFVLMFALVPIVIKVFNSDSVFGSGIELGVPSLGLSGMCMAFLGALLVLMPKVRIQTFFWFLITIRTYRVPVWFLGAWFIGFNVMDMLADDDIGGIGYLAHVTGAFSGIGLALLYKHLYLQPLALLYDTRLK